MWRLSISIGCGPVAGAVIISFFSFSDIVQATRASFGFWGLFGIGGAILEYHFQSDQEVYTQ